MRLSPKWCTFLAWGFGFILAETFGVITGIYLTASGFSQVSSGALGNAIVILSRFALLIPISIVSGLSLREAAYIPPIRPAWVTVISGSAIAAIGSSYFANSFTFQLLGIGYFARHDALWAFPIQILYYLSEIVVLNYIYIEAGKAWSWSIGPITPGMIFLILGWSLLHAITQNLFVAVYGVAVVLIIYIPYEHAKSPLTPVVVWFASLVG